MGQVLEKRDLECTDVVSLLCDYVDNELMPTLAYRVREHVEICPYCSAMMDSYSRTVLAARDLPEVEVSVDSHNRLRKGLNRRLGLKLPLLSRKE